MSESVRTGPTPGPAGRAGPRPEEEPEGPVVRDKRRIDPVTGQRREPAAGAPAAAPAGATTGGDTAAGDSPAGDTATPPGGTAAVGDPGTPAADEPTADPTGGEVDARVAELTADLQRLSAEYANYRRRVERDREAMTVQAAAHVLAGLLPVLDDIDRARTHGDLEGSFKAVGEAVEKVATTLGLAPYGEKGEPFDPTLHEALVSQPAEGVSEPSVAEVYRRGYRLGDRVLRVAQVVVAEPAA